MKTLLALLLAFTLHAQQTTVNGRKAYSGAVNAQTSTYQALVSDFNAPCGTIPVASGTFTITLVASTSQPLPGQCVTIINYGSGVVTIARSGQNINGGTTSLTLAAATATAPTGATVVSDGTNYEAALFGASSGGGGVLAPVAFASIPSPATVGRLQMFTDSPYFAYDTGSTWTYVIPGRGAFTPFVLGNFTLINAGTMVTSAVGGVVNLQTAEATSQFHGYCIAAPATPYTILVAVSVLNQNNGFPSGISLAFSDATKYETIRLTEVSNLNNVSGERYTTATSGATDQGTFISMAAGSVVSGLSITDDGTNKIFKWYTDPALKSPKTYLSETRTTTLTATQWCFGQESNGNSASIENGTFLGWRQE